MTRRVVIAPLAVPVWQPPGVDPERWRYALAEDAADLLATLAETDAAVAVAPEGRELAAAVVWPTTRVYEVPELTIAHLLAAAGADGYDQAALIAADAPDLPAMLIGKLLRPLTSRPVAVAPATPAGLLGLASRVPAPEWLLGAQVAGSGLGARADAVREAAPRSGQVAVTPGWHRLTGPEGFARLDPALEGWEATRALLSA